MINKTCCGLYPSRLLTAKFFAALAAHIRTMTETVLVTGGTGFLGSYVAADLIAEGHDVVAYDLSTDDHILSKLGVAEDVTVRRGDVTDPTDVVRAVRETGATRIVHLAALLTNAARENPRSALTVNVVGTNNVLEAARVLDDQVARVAWASSAAVYAPPDNYDTEFVDEDDLVYPDTLYGATKTYNEHQSRVYHEDYGVSHVGLRPTVAYGPYRETGGSAFLANIVEKPALGESFSVEYGPYRETGGSAFLANIVEKPALGESFSVEYGDQVIDWQHARDIAQAFRRAAFAPEDDLGQRVYNVRGEMATISEAVETVREILPEADLEVTEGGDLPWTQNLDMTAAQRDLGYDVEYDLETGFRSYINTLREEHGLAPV